MITTILVASIVSFVTTLLITPWFIRYLKKIELIVKDKNKINPEKKEDYPLIPISGGMAVMTGILMGILLFIFSYVFLLGQASSLTLLNLLAALLTIVIITFIGFGDDLMIDKKNSESAGFRQWQKPILTLIAAVPLMVIKAGNTEMAIPLLGQIDFGMLYPLLIIPLGVVISSNMVNMLAGLNGLETGLGIIYTGMLGLYAYTNQRFSAALILLITFASLGAFYKYSKYPSKIFPGDSLTYLLGGTIATAAIIGNIEKAAIISAIPFGIEFILKLKSKFKAHSYGYLKGKYVKSNYKKIYSIPHIFMKYGNFTEKQIVYCILIIQLVFSSLIWVV